MHKMLFLAFILLTVGCSLSSRNSTIQAFDKHFPELDFDTLHVYPSFPVKDAKPIPTDLLRSLPVSDTSELFPIGKFSFEKDAKHTVYIISTREQGSVFLLMLDPAKPNSIQRVVLASEEESHGAFSKLSNSWILDIDHDGSLDVATITDLIDHEMSNEYADNISGTMQTVLLFRNDGFEQEEWPDSLLQNAKLRK